LRRWRRCTSVVDPPTVEVDGALGAQLDHHVRELGHGEAAVDARAPAVAGDRDDEFGRDADRRPRVTSVRDVGIELTRAGGEPLAVLGVVEDDRAVADEQGAGVHEVAGRLREGVLPGGDADGSVLDDDAAAAGGIRREDRLVRDEAARDPELAERAVRVAHEEAADDRLVHLVLGTPDVEALRAWEVHDPDAGGRARMPHRVQGRHVPVGELVPPQQVFDPVPRHGRRAYASPEKVWYRTI
jgi:hypothetical protein